MLHLFYRLVVQPNTSRANTFAQAFISCGGIETLLVLLQREVKTGNHNILASCDESNLTKALQKDSALEDGLVQQLGLTKNKRPSFGRSAIAIPLDSDHDSIEVNMGANINRTTSASENQLLKNLGGISFSISGNSARNNVYNVDAGDGIVVGIISLLGALVTNGHLKIVSDNASTPSGSILGIAGTEGGTMFDDKVSLLLFALQKAFQAAPRRLMTKNVYTALLGAAVCISSPAFHNSRCLSSSLKNLTTLVDLFIRRIVKQIINCSDIFSLFFIIVIGSLVSVFYLDKCFNC